MGDQLYFSRDSKLLMKQGSNVWALPVLDGFGFSQGTNTSEVTLNEMTAADGTSRRARQMFTDSYAPAEFSFSTYARPFVAVPGATEGWEATDANIHAVEEALWANYVAINSWASGAWAEGINNSTSDMVIDFNSSNKSVLGTFELYFVMGGCANSGTPTIYKLDDCVLGSATINFDIDGIASLEWSGQASIMSEVASAPVVTISEAAKSTSNFIRNRLTALTVTASDHTTFPGESNNGVYGVVLTGGSISFENNITFLTPETLCTVNQPLGHVTGTRTIGGSFTAYLNAAVGSTAALWEDLIEATDTVTNSFELVFSIGGASAPRIIVTLPQCHLEVPNHSIDDIVSIETTFSALPTGLSETNECTVKYEGTAY